MSMSETVPEVSCFKTTPIFEILDLTVNQHKYPKH